MQLIPRNTAFFDEFDKHTALIVSAAQTLSRMLQPDAGPASDLARQIKTMPNRHLTALVQLVERSTVVTRDAVLNLRGASTRDRALELCIEINKLENEADAALRAGLAELFSDGMDPLSLIKWKEVFETLEDTTDRCEDVADAIQNLRLDS